MADNVHVHTPELRTLGAVALRGVGAEQTAQPKRLALLVYLAVAEPRVQRRDSILALLWPSANDASARTNLRQALSGIRQLLPNDVIETRGEDIWVSHETFSCDVWVFEEALARGEYGRAVELHRGPFLNGFYLKDCPEFEAWVEEQRVRLANGHAIALEALAQGSDDPRSAVAWWRRLAEHDPYSTRVALRFMEALEAAGDRAGALHYAQQHSARLRQELDAEPSPDVEAFAARLRDHPVVRGDPAPADGELERLRAALANRYAVERKRGAGGMANVYLAEDLRHDRRVALKVLRPELAAVLGADRFVQEIRTTAKLQHPHILPLFDSGEADGFLYYVMPFIEGETLRDKLNRETQLGIEEAAKIATEVADALDNAHRHNVIHRDIKPENILLHDGRPMVADFGIALAVSAAAGGRMTESGMSLGTPHYMSPEQATAEKNLTNRSDIYSLGCVLYELLAGTPPHVGSTVPQIIAKIVTDDVRPIKELRRSVPPNVAAATAKALEKLPADRFESAAKFADALNDPTFTIPSIRVGTAAGTSTEALWNRLSITATAFAVLLLLTTVWGWLRTRSDIPQPVSRFSILFPRAGGIAWSPDGTRFVYSEGGQLWLRERDQLRATPLSGAFGSAPVFSPDGERIAFVGPAGSGEVKVVSVLGGEPLTLIDTVIPYPWWLDWESEYIYLQSIAGLVRISVDGGSLEQVLAPDTALGAGFHRKIDVFPNGRGALTVTGSSPGQSTAGVVDFATGSFDTIAAGVLGRYAASGHVVVVQNDGTVLAAPFDQDALELTGVFVPILEEEVSVNAGGGLEFALSQIGDVLYLARPNRDESELVWVTRDGIAEEIDPGWREDFAFPKLSPDGTQLAISIVENNEPQLFIKQLDRGSLTKLTFEGSLNWRPTWVPNGLKVAFMSDRGASRGLYARRADGSAPAELLLEWVRAATEVTYSPDGEWLVFRVNSGTVANPSRPNPVTPGGSRDLYGLREGVDSVPVPLVTTEFEETSPAVSADGRWLAYVSNESGRWEVYVRPFPNTNDAKWPVSTNGGIEPVWGRTGAELFYKEGGNLVSVKVLPDPTFRTDERQVLFSVQEYHTNPNHQTYDVTPDDRRFVMIRGSRYTRTINLIENFFVELNQKVGN